MSMNISFDCDDLLKKFEFLGKNSTALKKTIYRAILRPIKRQVQANLSGAVLKRRTGSLARKTDMFVKPDGSSAWLGTTEKNRNKRNAWWVHAENTKGYTINHKKKAFLSFMYGDKWFKTKKSIFVKPNPTVKPAWEAGTADTVMVRIADEVLQKELDKWVKK